MAGLSRPQDGAPRATTVATGAPQLRLVVARDRRGPGTDRSGAGQRPAGRRPAHGRRRRPGDQRGRPGRVLPLPVPPQHRPPTAGLVAVRLRRPRGRGREPLGDGHRSGRCRLRCASWATCCCSAASSSWSSPWPSTPRVLGGRSTWSGCVLDGVVLAGSILLILSNTLIPRIAEQPSAGSFAVVLAPVIDIVLVTVAWLMFLRSTRRDRPALALAAAGFALFADLRHQCHGPPLGERVHLRHRGRSRLDRRLHRARHRGALVPVRRRTPADPSDRTAGRRSPAPC